MEQNQELLEAIHENARISKLTLGQLIKRSKDAAFRNVMAAQFAEYHNIVADAEQLAHRYAIELTGVCMEKAPIHAGLCLNVAIDHTSSHMAEMIMQGSVMGIIDVKRKAREYPDAAEEIHEIAKRLLQTEENNLRQMCELL